MRFSLASFLGSLKSQFPNGLDVNIKLPCTQTGCRAGKMGLAANFRDSTGKIVPLLVHVDGIDEPFCYMCYRSFYGGKVEDYASFLVREHGVERYLIAEFAAPPEVPFIARPPSPPERPQAPTPRGSSRQLPPRRSSGVAAPAPAPRSQAPAPRPAAPAVTSRPSAPALPAGRQAPAMQTRPAAPAPRPAAPSPRPAAPAPRKPDEERTVAPPTGSRALPPRRSSGVAAPEERPTAPAPRQDRRDERPRGGSRPAWTTPASKRAAEPKPTLGDLVGLADFKAEFKTAEDRARADAEREAAADQKWLDSVCARGTYRAAGKTASDGGILLDGGKGKLVYDDEGKPVFYPGGITGVIVGEGVCYVGTNDGVASKPTSFEELAKLRAAGWKNTRTVEKIGNGTPVVVALCDADGVVDHALQPEVKASFFQSPETPAWKSKFVPTEDTGTIGGDVEADIARERRIRRHLRLLDRVLILDDEDAAADFVEGLFQLNLEAEIAARPILAAKFANPQDVEPAPEVDSAEAAPIVA